MHVSEEQPTAEMVQRTFINDGMNGSMDYTSQRRTTKNMYS